MQIKNISMEGIESIQPDDTKSQSKIVNFKLVFK